MSVSSLLDQLRPVFAEDTYDWVSAHRSLRNKDSVKWHASAGLDWTPILELASCKIRGMHQAPKKVRQWLPGNSLFVFSDYSERWLTTMKRLYEDLDDVNPDDIGFQAFSPCGPTLAELFGLSKISSIECEEIIPLTLFSDCEVLRAQYPNFHSSMTISSIPDDEWHAVYLDVRLAFKGQQIRHQVLYLHLENLLCFEQVFQAHQIPIDVLYAKRVEGKSGSWEFIHSEKSQIMQSIAKSPVELRPKIWAADCPEFTRDGERIFGFASWYQPPWSTVITEDSDWCWISG